VLAFRRSSLERASRLLEWTKRRVDNDLADEADLFQAQAGFKLRQLNLQLAQEDEVKASRAYNEALGVAGASLDVTLEKISDMVSCCDALQLSRNGVRADVLAAEELLAAARLAQQEAFLRVGPEVSAFGSCSLNALDLTYGDTFKQITDTTKPTYTVGVNFSVPLGCGLAGTVKDGYRTDAAAAEQSLKKATLSAANSWDELQKNWANVKDRLALAREINIVQSKRVDSEQKRLQRGRTTTFQVLTAENDLDDATLNVYRMVFEELITKAQAELFNTQPIQ
jgi:outer membrane protein TolC